MIALQEMNLCVEEPLLYRLGALGMSLSSTEDLENRCLLRGPITTEDRYVCSSKICSLNDCFFLCLYQSNIYIYIYMFKYLSLSILYQSKLYILYIHVQSLTYIYIYSTIFIWNTLLFYFFLYFLITKHTDILRLNF